MKHLLAQIAGKLLAIWEGATIHRCKVVKQLLANGAAARLQLLRLPGYAPDLNPAEGVWKWMKRVSPGNVCCDDLTELRFETQLTFAKLRHRKAVLKGCLDRVDYL